MKNSNKLFSAVFILFLFLFSSTALVATVQGASPGKTYAYITNDDGTVSVIDTATKVTTTVYVGNDPFGVAVTSDGTKVYVGDQKNDKVYVIDTTTSIVTANINVGHSPYGVAVSPDGSKVYVANYDNGTGNTVSVINTATSNVTATVNVGVGPFGVAVSPDETKVYVTNGGSSTVSIIDTATNTVTAPVDGLKNPGGITINPTGTKVYVSSGSTDTIFVIDTAINKVTATVPVGNNPHGVAVSPDGSKVYVANYDNKSVSVIDTAKNSVIKNVSVGINPYGVAVTPDGKEVYVANRATNSNSGTVSVIDTATNSVTATVTVGRHPKAFGQFIGYVSVQDPILPVASFSTNVTSGNAPLTVQFTDASQYASGWSWDFDSNGILDSTEKNPVHVYSTAGTYTAQLTASNENGTDPETVKISVTAAGTEDNTKGLPVAVPSANVTSGYIPLTVLFTDLSQNITSRTWDIGNDGTIESTDASFIYEFSSRGDYPINLTVSNENGTVSKLITISAQRKSSSGGSGGGGGAGGSPEPAKNVKVKELCQVFITSGKTITFDFTKNATSIVSLNFDSKKTVGKTTTIVEMLKNKSTLTPDAPEGEVYTYLNIWVGNGGYGSDEDNLENAVINFKVEKSWIKDKGIDQSSITLNRYNDKKWNELPTTLTGEDGKYMYFKAETPGFSPFTITGISKGVSEKEAEKENTETSISEEKGNNTSEPDKEQSNSNHSVLGKIIFTFIGIPLFLLGIFRKHIEKRISDLLLREEIFKIYVKPLQLEIEQNSEASTTVKVEVGVLYRGEIKLRAIPESSLLHVKLEHDILKFENKSVANILKYKNTSVLSVSAASGTPSKEYSILIKGTVTEGTEHECTLFIKVQ